MQSKAEEDESDVYRSPRRDRVLFVSATLANATVTVTVLPANYGGSANAVQSQITGDWAVSVFIPANQFTNAEQSQVSILGDTNDRISSVSINFRDPSQLCLVDIRGRASTEATITSLGTFNSSDGTNGTPCDPLTHTCNVKIE